MNLRPFPVDPAVMAALRPMAAADVPQVARLHQAAMGNSLWAKLGLPFLEALYRELLRDPVFRAHVYLEDGRVGGFIAGATDSQGLFTRTLRRGWRALAGPLLLGILRNPSTLPRLLTTPLYFRRSSPGDDIPAESLFCSFAPELRGTRVSGHINKVLFERLLAEGHRHVKITTEVDNVGANRQLRSWGFEERGRFRFYGKDMVTYALLLEGHPRLEPPTRNASRETELAGNTRPEGGFEP